jgi:glycosyltransferase involved in cell wall biosynthesis
VAARPALTCIVPTYNRAAYVRDCLIALRESGVPDLEVIVSDDGSTDDTAAVVAATDPKAKYLWQHNSGTPSTARNAAFAVSTGRYVGFLDCDDAWLPGTAATAVRLLDGCPEIEVLFGDARMGNPDEGFVSWIESAGQDAFFRLPHREPEPGFRVLDRRALFRRMAVRNPLFIGACIMRREAFEKSGGFDPDLRGAADWDLWLRMASRFTFGFLQAPLAIYTRHLENMSSDHDHMIGEFCQTLANTLRNCELVPDDQQWIRGQLRHHLFSHAYLAYDRGDTAEAAKRFRRAVAAGDSRPMTLALATTCLLPTWAVQRLRRLKQGAFA